MSPLPASIDTFLASPQFGGAAACLALVLLLAAQALHWQGQSVPSVVGRLIGRAAAVMCLIVVILISARFAIVR